jgi:predicted lipid-binding transport protein (Tim44 family)
VLHLSNVFQNFNQRLNGSSHYSANALALKKRSGFEIAGFFILLALILLIASYVFNGSAHPQPVVHKSVQSQPASVELQSSQNSGTSPDANAAPVTPQTNSVSTNVTSHTDANGNTSTQVSVNGQPVSVPQNGSVHQQVGNSQVDVSNTRNGNSSNLSVSNTDLNIDSSSNSSITTGGN